MGFDTALKIILRAEGGFVDHPNDRGGATNKGITQRVYDNFRRSRGLGLQTVRDIADREVSAIYLNDYWMRASCNKFPSKLALVVVDAAVNHGPGRALKLLQQVIDVNPDGVFGPKSFAALKNTLTMIDEPSLVDLYLAERAGFYDAIVARDPTQAVFEKGWKNRLAHLRKDVATA